MPPRPGDLRGLRSVLFDLNGVLIRPPAAAAFKRLSRLAEVAMPGFEALYWRYRDDYDRGTLDLGEYWQKTGADAGRSYSSARIRALVHADCEMWSVPNRTMVKALRSLTTRAVPTAIISNTPRDLRLHLAHRHPWTRLPVVAALSFSLGAIKPEPEIFRRCLAELGSKPRETVLIDDRRENVEGARALGLHARLWTRDEEPRIVQDLNLCGACRERRPT